MSTVTISDLLVKDHLSVKNSITADNIIGKNDLDFLRYKLIF